MASLERRAEHDGHAVRDTAKNAAAMVRLSDDLAVFDRKGVVILAAAKARHAKARAELDALDRRNAENSRGDAIFHATEHRIAKPAGAPKTAHSMTPPTLSPASRAAAMASRISSPRASLTTGNSLPTSEPVSSPSSEIPAMERCGSQA